MNFPKAITDFNKRKQNCAIKRQLFKAMLYIIVRGLFVSYIQSGLRRHYINIRRGPHRFFLRRKSPDFICLDAKIRVTTHKKHFRQLSLIIDQEDELLLISTKLQRCASFRGLLFAQSFNVVTSSMHLIKIPKYFAISTELHQTFSRFLFSTQSSRFSPNSGFL